MLLKNLLAVVSLAAFTCFAGDITVTNVTHGVHFELETNWSYETNYNAVAYGYTSDTNKIVDGYQYFPTDYYLHGLITSNNFADIYIDGRLIESKRFDRRVIHEFEISWTNITIYTTNVIK